MSVLLTGCPKGIWEHTRCGESKNAEIVKLDQHPSGCGEGQNCQSAGLHETNESLLWLKRAYEEGDPNMNFLNVEPALDELRPDVRFRELLLRIGLQ